MIASRYLSAKLPPPTHHSAGEGQAAVPISLVTELKYAGEPIHAVAARIDLRHSQKYYSIAKSIRAATAWSGSLRSAQSESAAGQADSQSALAFLARQWSASGIGMPGGRGSAAE